MKLSILFYSGLLSVLLLAGCDSLRQEVEPKGITREGEKLVVTCFISPQDTVLVALVTRSLPVLGTADPILTPTSVRDATVTLSDGSQTITMTSTIGRLPLIAYDYRADAREMPIIVGKTYTLTVSVPDGRQVTARCTVPGPVPIDQVVLDSSITNEFGLTTKNYHARLRWRDPAGQPNYYRVAGDNEYTYRSQYVPTPGGPVKDTLIKTRSGWTFNNGSTTTDIGRDGQEIVSQRARLAIAYSWINGQQQVSRPTGPINAYLLSVDENYYRYHDSVERQNEVGGNPFAEPVPIQTNVQGGLGCFGAYNQARASVTFR
ncbi:DUF4249 domain-containing protein [Spirosoma sp. 209]|uniref:DUF4249 domain-containing protein n=1 Tax=Spirosoma sp. 209 TaxID=1955701 RepID=UPI00098D5551|nr:DUF4249 domain-containing protein [Spirosoma sp. 209]